MIIVYLHGSTYRAVSCAGAVGTAVSAGEEQLLEAKVNDAGGDSPIDVLEPGGSPAAGEPGEPEALPAAGLDELERVVEGGLEPAQRAPPRRHVAAARCVLEVAEVVADGERTVGEMPAPGLVPACRLSRFRDLLRQLEDRAHYLHDRSR